MESKQSGALEEGLTIKRVPLDALCLDPANTRSHGDANPMSVKRVAA